MMCAKLLGRSSRSGWGIKDCVCLCVCVCARARVRACVRVCVTLRHAHLFVLELPRLGSLSSHHP